MLENNILDHQNPLFCIKDKKIYIQNIGHIWPTFGTFEKSETGTKSMCRSVMASSLKKCSSLKIKFEVNVKYVMEEGRGGGGPAWVWGSDLSDSHPHGVFCN